MATVKDILTTELNLLVIYIKQSLQKNKRNATGKTINSVFADVEDNNSIVTGFVYAPSHVLNLEFGRLPTQGEPTGNSEWYNGSDFDNWLIARNIPLEAKYPIFKKIHEEGYEGTKGLISDPIEESLDRIQNRIADVLVDNAFSNL